MGVLQSSNNFLLILRKICCSRDVVVLFLKPDDNSPHTEKMRSTKACEAGALMRSSATRASFGYEVKSEGRRPPTHRIAFNSLYLFSLGLLSMRQMERYCMIHAWSDSSPAGCGGLRASAVFSPASTLENVREAWPP